MLLMEAPIKSMSTEKEDQARLKAVVAEGILESGLGRYLAHRMHPITEEAAVKVGEALTKALITAKTEPGAVVSIAFDYLSEISLATDVLTDESLIIAFDLELDKENSTLAQFEFTNGSALILNYGKGGK